MQELSDTVVSAEFALAGAVLAASGAAFAMIPLAMLRHAFPARRARRVAWGPLHVLLVALLYLSSAVLLVGFAGEDPGLAAALLVTAASQGIAVAAILYWVNKNDPGGWSGLGLAAGGNARAIAFAIAAGVMSYPMIMGANFLWPWLFERMGGEFEQQAFIADFTTASGVQLWISVLLAVVVVPLSEELIFRGFVQSLTVQRFGEVTGVVLASALFAILHGPSAFLPIFALALVLGVIMLRTGRITAVWGLHGLYNGGQIVFLLLFDSLADQLTP